jgi:hypothetical protein
MNEKATRRNLLATLKGDGQLKIDSERRLPRPISRVLGSLWSSQLPEQRIVDRRHGRRKVGVV